MKTVANDGQTNPTFAPIPLKILAQLVNQYTNRTIGLICNHFDVAAKNWMKKFGILRN